MSDPRDLLGAYVRAVHGWNRQSVQGEGKVVAYSEGPQYLIETAPGRQFWWREHLVEVVPEEARKSTPLVSDETPDQVTLDDLLPVGWIDPREHGESITGFQMCTRCSGVVYSDDRGEALAGHERWHAAIEDLSVTVKVEDGRLLTLDHDAIKLGSAGASAQAEEFQPLRDQLIVQLKNTNLHQNAEHWVDLLMPVIEAWMDVYASRATTAEALAEQLRAQLEQEIGHLDRCNERHAGLSRGETDRLRRVEDALVAAGAPNRSEPGDPGGLQVAWIQAQAAELDAFRSTTDNDNRPLGRVVGDLIQLVQEFGCGQDEDVIVWVRGKLEELVGADQREAALIAANKQLRSQRGEPVSPTVAGIIDAQHTALLRLAAKGRRAYASDFPGDGPVFNRQPEQLRQEAATFDTAAKLIEDPRRLAGLIPTSMQNWSLDDDVAEIVAKATGIRVVLLDPQPEPTGADPTPPAEGAELTPGQWIAKFLTVSAEERLQTVEALLAHADAGHACFLMNHVRRIQDADDYQRRLMAVVLKHADPDALETHGGMLGFLDQELGWLASYRKEAVAKIEAEGISDEQLSDLLLLVGVTPSAAQLSSWTDEQREQAARWAGAVHLDASDNDVDVPERPAFLDEYPSEPCPSLYLAPDGQLRPCNLAIELHLKPSSGPDDHWHAYLIDSPDGDAVQWRWQGKDAVPVPWPLDQEPPAGIDVLRDTGDGMYLCRMVDSWGWWSESTMADRNNPDGNTEGHAWAPAVDQATGELHVVRP